MHGAAAAFVALAPSRTARLLAMVPSSVGTLLAIGALADSIAFLLDPSGALVSPEVGLLALPLRLALLAAYLVALLGLARGGPPELSDPTPRRERRS
jgi:hypothetical protein